MKNPNKISQNQIYKRTAIAHILVIIALPFFAYWGYKNSNWVIEIVCSIAFLLTTYNVYKYFFKIDYRKHLNEYHDQQESLPWRERDMYRPVYGKVSFFLATFVLLITILAGIILNFFNLL